MVPMKSYIFSHLVLWTYIFIEVTKKAVANIHSKWSVEKLLMMFY